MMNLFFRGERMWWNVISARVSGADETGFISTSSDHDADFAERLQIKVREEQAAE